ncbi:MAG: dethiobiotin synthetase [Campylobacterota bacterium]|nr:dethiobiotin synthetase [Campylobacterota bacterium]
MKPKKRFLITASNTNCGKTFVTLKLLQEFAKNGYKVGAFKPIETGVENLPHDGTALLEKCKELNSDFKNITIDYVVPIKHSLAAAPYVSKKESIDFKKIQSALKKIESVCDVVFIETAGGIMTPIDDDFFVIDFARFFDANVIFITTDKLGTISETLVNHYFLNNKNIKFNWCINLFGSIEEFNKINRPFLDNHFDKLFLIPTDIKEFVTIL